MGFDLNHAGGGGGGEVIPAGTVGGQLLVWDGAAWIAQSEGTVAGQVLTWDGTTWIPDTITPTSIDPGAVNTVLWTGAGPAVSWTGSPIISGSLSVGTAPFAAAGAIRLPNNITGGISWRNAANSADIVAISVNASNQTTIVGPGGIILANSVSGASSATFTSGGGQNILLSGVAVSFASVSLTPIINQAADATATIVGDTFTFQAQDVSGNTATTGGMLFLRGGDATGTAGTHNGGAFSTRGGDATGAAGTRNGGDWLAEPGSGATLNGSLRLRNAAGTDRIVIDSTGIGFFAVAPVARQDITGSRATGAALADLLTKLALTGLITDSTSA